MCVFQDQYEYTHMVIKSLCEEWLQEFAKHDYENILNREEVIFFPVLYK